MTFLRHFLAIVAAALGASLLGGIFAIGIALLSPEFVRGLMSPGETGDPLRFAAALGLIWGLFLGTGVMIFCILIQATTTVAGHFLRQHNERAGL